MRLIQFEHTSLGHCLGAVRGERVFNITELEPTLAGTQRAFQAARRSGRRLEQLLQEVLVRASGSTPLNYAELLAQHKVLPPISPGSGVQVLVSGTGLTHKGSVQQRDAMHKALESAGPKTASQEMFEMGLAGGRPPAGERGTAPEWFYKGDFRIVRGPGQELDIPSFAPDGGEEPEVVAIYVVDDAGIPCRLGFTQGNEWSDHATESVNYLYLAPSKLRTCAIGPELVTDFPFEDVRGRCRVLRDGQVIYDSGELLTGERNLCHSLANLEDHHFKFPQHRHPEDVHVHFLGTSKLSYRHRDWQYQTGDVVEVSFEGLGPPLCNPVCRYEPSATPVAVQLG